MDLFSEIENLKSDDDKEKARALLLLFQKVNIPLDSIVKAFNEERPDDIIDFLIEQAGRSDDAVNYANEETEEGSQRVAALFEQAETTTLSDILPQATAPQTVADEPVVEDLKEEASDIAPEVVEEALTIAQRLSGIIPSRRQLEQELDSDLIEKATELRKLDKQKAAYDAAFRAGGFAREMAGQAPLQYGFAPAIAPEELSAEDIAAQKTALLRQVSELQRAKARLLGEQQKSGRESGRTQREIYQMLLRMQEERIKTMTDAEEKRYNDLQVRFKEAGKEVDAAREKLDLRKNKKAGTVETAAAAYLNNAVGKRRTDFKDTFNSLQTDPIAQYLLIKRTAEAFSANTVVNEGGKFKIGPRTFLDENEFVEAALTLGAGDDNRDSIRQAFKSFKSQAVRVNELEQDQIEIRKQLDELVWPGVSKFYADKLRTANPWFEQQFVSGSGSGVVQAAPPASDISNASSYVASVAPGAVLAGSEVKMPSGDVVSYDDFVSQFPSAVYDPETQSYGSLAPATRFLEKTIEQVQDEISDLDEPSLSEMEERKQEIMEDPRFGQYMQRFGYTDPDKAFEYFKSDYAARRKISGPTTDRQKRDAAIMSGQAMGTLPQRIGAVARTALGPAGRDRRQRRRQAILNILSPGAKKSRITETDARTTVPTEDAPETAPAQAVASPPPAPTEESTLPLVWTEAEGTPYAKYSFDADGNLTMTRYNPETKAYDGETKIIDPDKNKKAYDAITALRSNPEKGKGLVFPEKPASGADAETQTAVGRAVVQEAVEGKQAPTALPRQVPLSKEQFKDELSRIPDAPEDIQISPLERLRFALDERRMRPLKEGSRARAKSEAEGAARRKDVGIKAAEDAISRARMLDEEPPAWALATIDSLPLAPQDRGEIRAEGSEAPGSLVDPTAVVATVGSPGGSPGVPLGVSARSDEELPDVGYFQQGIAKALPPLVAEPGVASAPKPPVLKTDVGQAEVDVASPRIVDPYSQGVDIFGEPISDDEIQRRENLRNKRIRDAVLTGIRSNPIL